MTSPAIDRRISLATVPNFRDLGGLRVEGGTVRAGQIFRSTALSALAGDDVDAFGALDVMTVFDLRTAGERIAKPDALPAGVRSVDLDVLADSSGDVAAGVANILTNPGAAAAALGHGAAEALMKDSYRNIVSLPSALAAYRAFFLDLIDDERTGGALFHCTTGKDRTGWAAAVFLRAVGVSEEDVRADYLQTNADLLPALAPMIEAVRAAGVDPELLMPVFGVRDEYLDAAVEEARTRFGSLEGYVTDGLGLTAAHIDALRDRFVVAD